MNPNQRKQLLQIVVLAVLLIGLGFSMWRMLAVTQGTSAPAKPAQPALINQPQVDKLGAATQTPSAATESAAAEGGAPLAIPEQIEMNPNLFRVYKLDPPKNPFKQEESWYQEELEQIPGYPELRDSGFLETMSPVVPDMGELLGEDEAWREVQMTKTQAEKQYSISGNSEDETINTTLSYLGPEGRTIDVTWTPGMGVPLSALSDPNWQQTYHLPATGELPATMPPDEDLFLPPAADGGLKIPGIDEVITGGVVPGDQIYCHGINVQDGRAYALVSFNGTTRLVQVGDSLPPRYTVEAITGDGAVLFNLRTEQTQWLPIRAPMPQDAGSGGITGAAAGSADGTAVTPMPAPIIPVGGRV